MSMSEQLSMTTWEMKLSWNGEETELDHVQKRIELPLIDKDGMKLLPLHGFDWELSPGEVQREAELLIECLNGELRLEGINGSFTPSGLYRNEPDGKATQYVFGEGVSQLRIGVFFQVTCYDKDGNPIPESPLQPKPLPGVGLKNPQLRKALGLVARVEVDDWPTLYKIVELIITSGAPLKDWGLSKQLDKVKDVANNPHAIGDKARHAVAKGSGSKARMTFDQAKACVFQAVQKWITHESDKLK
ncbi:hypothetical protein ACYPKM_03850 [Pseudomonas aeruginosa]